MPPASLESTVDFDLFGLLRVRVASADARQLDRIERQLGTRPTRSSHDPHLVVSFGRPNDDETPMVMVGTDGGCVDDTYVIARDGARTAVPFDRLNDAPVIHCDPAVVAIPQLVPLLNAIFLSVGVLPLHASTAELDGVGVAVAGWSKGGKTEALLALISAGGTPIADEWTYVQPQTRMAHGTLGPVRLTAEHLHERPELRTLVGQRRRLAMASAAAGARFYRRMPVRSWRRVRWLDWMHRFVAVVESAAAEDVSLGVLGATRGPRAARLEHIALVVAGESAATSLSWIDPATAVERMVAAHMHHRMGLLEHYDAFRFCFPTRRSSLIDELEDRERQQLTTLFGDRDVPVITHPHPAPIEALQVALLRAFRR